MTLGLSPFVEEDFLVACVMRGRIRNLLTIVRSILRGDDVIVRNILTRTPRMEMLANAFTSLREFRVSSS
ncbi:hypothetical protein A2U01_0082863 [Trifolium medium]|uniref:Uncharacterized protein n=1 Tax=Trifolium medium TaxID=97028 RepID=A0A392TN91_9FABA|nr:hypothetical protein [Trifolium medium]